MAHHSIWVRDLVKRYGKLTAVDQLSFTVEGGEIVGLVGQNGAGKTSTLRCLAGIIRPTQGTVHVAGHNLELDPIPAKRELAFVPDDPRFFHDLTVEEHLRFVARLYNVEDAEDQGRDQYAGPRFKEFPCGPHDKRGRGAPGQGIVARLLDEGNGGRMWASHSTACECSVP